MTAIDWTDPVALAEEARLRQARRAEGRPLSDAEPVIALASARKWPTLAIELPRPRSIALKKAEQQEVLKVFKRFGVRRWKSTSQARRSKIGVGIPDLWVFGPEKADRDHLVAWWWETKSGERWEFSAAQLEFADDCRLRGVLYGCGDRFAAETFCRAIGLEEL